MEHGEDKLAKLLEQPQEADRHGGVEAAAPTPTQKGSKLGASVSQWTVSGNDRFFPVGKTISRLMAGVYQVFSTIESVGMEQVDLNSDGIYTLPDMATETVLREVETFWNNEALYRKHRLLYKRGILLWGPPGSGKTITVKLLMNEIIRRDGLVLLINHVPSAISILKDLRNIEKDRNIILVYEDIDEIILHNGEAIVLSLLDGEHNIDRVLNLATTNYPGRLGARIVNRPSRFDRRIFIDVPSPAARQAYLQKVTEGVLSSDILQTWAADTEGMSIAHLRELVAAVFCLGQDYADVLERLKAMSIRPTDGDEGFRPKKMGLTIAASQGASTR